MAEVTIKKQASFLFVGQLLSFIILTASPIILSRLMTVEDYGAYQQILFVGTLVVSVVHFRLPGSLYYFYPRKSNSIETLLSQTCMILILASLAGSLVVYSLGSLSMLPTAVSQDFLSLLVAYIVVESVGQIIDHIFVLEKKPVYSLLKGVINSSVRLALIMGAVIFTDDVKYIISALVVLASLRVFVLAAFLKGQHEFTNKFFDKGLFLEQSGYILPLAGANVVGMIGKKFDRLVIAYEMSPADFAIYTLGGLGLMSAVTMLYTSVGNVCLPKLSGFASIDDLGSARKLWHKMVLLNSLATIPIVIFCSIMAPVIITILFGEKYIQSAEVWRINLWILPMQMLAYGYLPRAFGKTTQVLKANIARFIVSLPLIFILVNTLGLIGGAIGFVVGFWINGLMQMASGKKVLNLGLKEFLPWKDIGILVVVSCCFSPIVVFVANLDYHNFLILLVAASLYFPIIILCALAFDMVDINEFRGLMKMKKRKE